MRTRSRPAAVWGYLWRSTLWSIAAGALLGGLYGAMIGILISAGPSFANDYPDVVMSEREELGAAAGATLFISLVGGWFGAMFGAAMGLATGLLLGAIVAGVAAWSSTATDPAARRRTAGRAGMLAPLPLLPVLWAAYVPASDPVLGLLLIALLPVLIACLVSRVIGRRVAGRWAMQI